MGQHQSTAASMASSEEPHTVRTGSRPGTIRYRLSTSAPIFLSLKRSSAGQRFLPGDEEHFFEGMKDMELLTPSSSKEELANVVAKYSEQLKYAIKTLRLRDSKKKLSSEDRRKLLTLLGRIRDLLCAAWAVANQRHELGEKLCATLHDSCGLDLLIANCASPDAELQLCSLRLLEQSLTVANRAYVAANGLENVVRVACVAIKTKEKAHARVGSSVLEHLFKLGPDRCSELIELGGLAAVLFACRKKDVETLLHCAAALTNLAMFGGADNQKVMIEKKAHVWLFPLVCHKNDTLKYLACLAAAVLVANVEIEGAVLHHGILDTVAPLIRSYDPPSKFARGNPALAHGRSEHWLRKLLPVLSSKREEARSLAAFHFCVEAGIKKDEGRAHVLREIGAVEPLQKCAEYPNAVISKYAAQALVLMDEKVPRKLSQHVAQWSTEDVGEWVRQIGFPEYADQFVQSRTDGTLLLRITEDTLSEDIGIANGILRKRFVRELEDLKTKADYSCLERGEQLSQLLAKIDPQFPMYTFDLLSANVDKDTITKLSDDDLRKCGVANSLHRQKIRRCIESSCTVSPAKVFQAFISYRRSNGAHLASLIKSHLVVKKFEVFLDVKDLGSGNFTKDLPQHVRQARNFILILTAGSLDRCFNDPESNDWVRKEISIALKSKCNIIPITDKDFVWPPKDALPTDIRDLPDYNALQWEHNYQDGCVDKLVKFLRTEA